MFSYFAGSACLVWGSLCSLETSSGSVSLHVISGPLPCHMVFLHGLFILVAELLTWSLRTPKSKDKAAKPSQTVFLPLNSLVSQLQGLPRINVEGNYERVWMLVLAVYWGPLVDSRDLTICSIYKKKELVKSISPHVFAQNSPKASVCI